MNASRKHFWVMLAVLLCAAAAYNALQLRREVRAERSSLASFPSRLGDWEQLGEPFRFGSDVEAVLGASDYTMREYSSEGRVANVYIGYYDSQRTGATYHSPQNCLPGAGWALLDPHTVEITRSDGSKFNANAYVIDNGAAREVMIYWYQGRGRTSASEYGDKLRTIYDSLRLGRTDGAMIRVMADARGDTAAGEKAALDLAAKTADKLPPFIPE